MSETEVNEVKASAAAEAQKAEAVKEPFTVDIDGVDYTPEIQADGSELYDAVEALENGRVLAALRMLLGEAEYKRYKSHKPNVAIAARAVRDIQKKMDVDLGELLD